jgi:F-box interacting protein
MQSKLCKRDADDGANCGLSLPEDIILEVLLRLPAKALRRFRCVCKGWRDLILDPSFVAARRSRGCADTLIVALFGRSATTTTTELELRLLDDGGNVLRVFGIGGPAALLAPTRHDLIFVDRMQLGATIIDPASGRASLVVGRNKLKNKPYWSGSKLTLLNDYSFGRASPSGDYKVLHIAVAPAVPRRHYDYGYMEWCEVATIIDGGGGGDEPTWRQRPWGPFRTSISSEHKASVNGVLYFMPYDTYSHGRNHIAAFDLESEEWKPETIRGPRLGLKKETDKWSIALVELKGTLCVVHNVRHLTSLGGHYANMWLLTDPSRGVWVKEYTVQMPERFLLSTKPLDVLGDGTILLLLNTYVPGRREHQELPSVYPSILQHEHWDSYGLHGDGRRVQW